MIGKAHVWCIAYLIICILREHAPFFINQVFSPLLLATAVISIAFSRPQTSDALLHGHDISYGVYIYHMLVFNFLIQFHYMKSNLYLWAGLVITVGVATMSWIFIEKNALNLKEQLGVILQVKFSSRNLHGENH